MAKPPIRVLVVDDYEPFRGFVVSTIGQQFELQTIGEASDGLGAVHKAEELQPDLIVLDIGLPTLSGIQAARRIRQFSPKSKILFLSANRSPDIVKEALHIGAGGYVLKSDAGSELLPAVEAVLQDKQFVSSSLSGHLLNCDADMHRGNASSRDKGEIFGRHEALFYSDDRHLLDGLSQFIGTALKSGNATVTIATQPHRESLARRLQADGVDIAAAIEQRRYISFDAADMISMFMVNGVFEAVRFLELFGELVVKVGSAAEGKRPRIALFGECPDLLWKQGHPEAAIQDEKLGNQLLKTYDVDILCGYSLDSLAGEMGSYAFDKICAEHSAVRYR